LILFVSWRNLTAYNLVKSNCCEFHLCRTVLNFKSQSRNAEACFD
ncbi:hypothetical protein Tsp_06868, partial [Trichinella spiralis]